MFSLRRQSCLRKLPALGGGRHSGCLQIRASQPPKDEVPRGKPPHHGARPSRASCSPAPRAPLLLTLQSCFLPPQEPEQVGSSRLPPGYLA